MYETEAAVLVVIEAFRVEISGPIAVCWLFLKMNQIFEFYSMTSQ